MVILTNPVEHLRDGKIDPGLVFPGTAMPNINEPLGPLLKIHEHLLLVRARPVIMWEDDVHQDLTSMAVVSEGVNRTTLIVRPSPSTFSSMLRILGNMYSLAILWHSIRSGIGTVMS